MIGMVVPAEQSCDLRRPTGSGGGEGGGWEVEMEEKVY